MSELRIAQAASSETFSKYGVAPNQRRTGVTPDNPGGNMDGELNVQTWVNAGWEVAFRPIDKGMADFIARFMTAAVANGAHIGYSQDQTRTGVFDALAALGSTDPADIITLVNCDCATLVGAAVYYAGYKDDRLRKLCTWEMRDVLGKSGLFVTLTDPDLLKEGKGICRGDILLKTGHTAVSIDTDDRKRPRISITEEGIEFADDDGNLTAVYPANAAKLLKENELRTVQASGNAWYPYSTKGSATYHLQSDRTYLVTCCERNNTTSANMAVWIVSAHRNNSHLYALKSSNVTRAAISGLSLTITRGCVYSRVTITCLS